MEPTCSYFELLDKENSLSFDLSLLDCIPLNEDDNLDSVEATICFLTDGIQKKSRRKLNTLRPQKWKISRRANISLLHFLRNRLNLFPFLCPEKHLILPSGQLAFLQIGAAREMGVLQLY